MPSSFNHDRSHISALHAEVIARYSTVISSAFYLVEDTKYLLYVDTAVLGGIVPMTSSVYPPIHGFVLCIFKVLNTFTTCFIYGL